MNKTNRYKVDKDLERARNEAGRALYKAKCRFLRWDLSIRMGRPPTEDEVTGVALDNPMTLIEVRETIREFKRARLAKRRKDASGDPIYTWENVGLPMDRKHSISDQDARLHMQFLRECNLLAESEE